MRTITALFDSRADAEAARERLAASGLAPASVQIIAADETHSAEALPPGGRGGGERRSLFESLKDFLAPDDDRRAYAEAVRRGGFLLTARAPDDRAEAVCGVLGDSGAIDFNARQSQWRSEGWEPEAGETEAERGERPARGPDSRAY